jgi:hypothetical protein
MLAQTANMVTEGQVVQLDLGGKTSALPCCVIGFTGPAVLLAPIVPPTAPTAEAIQAGREAYVVIDDDQQVHALRATVRPGSEPGEVLINVTDAFRLGARIARTGNDGEQADRLAVTLSSPAAGLRIETQADVVRRSQRDLAISFCEISDGDVALLTQITVAYYRLAR